MLARLPRKKKTAKRWPGRVLVNLCKPEEVRADVFDGVALHTLTLYLVTAGFHWVG